MAVTDGSPALPLDERSLVERARHDPDAFAELYRRYLPKIYRFAYRRCGSKPLAEDATAQAFEKALCNLDGFRWKAGGFSAWLHRIAANELATLGARQSRSPDRQLRAQQAVSVGPGADPFDRIDEGPEIDRMLEALDTLNPRYQRAISLRYLADLTHAEAAQAMGVTKPVMAVTLNRAMAALRKAMIR